MMLQEVIDHVPAEVCNMYIKAREAVRERELAQQSAQAMEKLEARLRKEMNDQITPAKRLIIEKVLTSSCPRCNAAFLDFDGCMALKCSRPGCGAAFCAICLAHCGEDAHAHVRTCTHNTESSGHVFVDMELFEKMKKSWRITKIREVSASQTV
jgi:hypothetical protein